MAKLVLTLNAGSSSIKFAAFSVANGGESAFARLGTDRGSRGDGEGLGQGRRRRDEAISLSSARSPASIMMPAMGAILGWLQEARLDNSVAAVGHRVVHGGPDLVDPMLIDARGVGETEDAHPAGAAAPAAQHRRHRGGDEGLSVDPAGRLLRHRLPPQPPVRVRHLRAAALLLRRRRATLRLPRPLLRVSSRRKLRSVAPASRART